MIFSLCILIQAHFSIFFCRIWISLTINITVDVLSVNFIYVNIVYFSFVSLRYWVNSEEKWRSEKKTANVEWISGMHTDPIY